MRKVFQGEMEYCLASSSSVAGYYGEEGDEKEKDDEGFV